MAALCWCVPLGQVIVPVGLKRIVQNTRLYKGFKFVAQAKAEGDKREAVSYVFHVFSSDSVKPAIWRMRAKEIKATPFVEAVDAEVAKL